MANAMEMTHTRFEESAPVHRGAERPSQGKI